MQGHLPGDTGTLAAEMAGFPVHEIVGEVVATAHPAHRVGDRVVGWASSFDGLMEYVTSDGDGLAPYDPALSPAHAVGLQPLACILYAVEQLPPLEGKHVAVIGQGSIGLLFSYVAKAFGGTVFYFGVPDDDSYPISMRTILRNNLTLKSGVTLDRRRVLEAADTFAREHPDLLGMYVTHTFGIGDVQEAFEFACRPTPGRVKIVIAGS